MMYESIRRAVLDGKPRLVEKNIKEALWKGLDPKDILEQGLMAALDSIEDIECDNEEQITQTLACARAMKKGMESLDTVMGGELQNKGVSVVIGTASGDLHDMGKNIVALYFRIAGFSVVDLGVDVSALQFLKALENNRDARIVCISSLLKTSYTEVRHIIQSIRSTVKGRDLFIMVGGSSMTEEMAHECGADCYTENAASAVRAALEYVK
ncbi:MAG: cobalamin-dependent protein [Lachnospiraceae bacterium]|nr:cobalamin-dependent protein [Lachnospiraceae bacterium]